MGHGVWPPSPRGQGVGVAPVAHQQWGVKRRLATVWLSTAQWYGSLKRDLISSWFRASERFNVDERTLWEIWHLPPTLNTGRVQRCGDLAFTRAAQ